MRKNKKQYFWFPVVEKAETCPCCKKPLVQSKLMAVLYDGLNQNSIQQAHKMAYCSDCHVPFLTKKAVSGIEGENPGFHLETGKLIPKMSKAFLLKKVSTPAHPEHTKKTLWCLWAKNIFISVGKTCWKDTRASCMGKCQCL